MERRGDQLLDRILAGTNDSAANDLLAEIVAGYPVENLRILLESNHDGAVRAGAWIASELGSKAAPLVDELSRMLPHSSRYVRFFLLDAILAGATTTHGAAIARAVLLIQDPETAVRWKALHFLAKAGHDQLGAALPYLSDTIVEQLLDWLLEHDSSQTSKKEIASRLDDPDRLRRRFAAAAAARLGVYGLDLLKQAARSNDTEIKSFTEEQLKASSRSSQ